MVINKLIEPGLNAVLSLGIFLSSTVVFCLQQKRPNQNTLFVHIFTDPGQVAKRKDFVQ